MTIVLRSALKKSVARTRRFLNQRGEWDPYYAAARVRLEARQFIRLHSLEVSEDEDEHTSADFESSPQANIGLQFFCRGVVAKVLKRSTDPDMPLPTSASKKRNGFYSQQRQFLPHPTLKDLIRVPEWNAVYLWDCNEDHLFSRLSVALPRTGGRKADMSYYWMVDIPLLSTVRDSTVEYGAFHNQQTLIDDVPGIGLPEDETETGTNDAT